MQPGVLLDFPGFFSGNVAAVFEISMSLKLQIINPLEFNGWDELLLTNQESSFFHSETWARVLYDTYKYTPIYFCAFQDHKLSALVPVMEINSKLTGRRGVSLPFTDTCEPIIGHHIPFHAVMNTIIQYGKKARWETFVFTGGTRFFRERTPSRRFYMHMLDLTKDEKQIFSGFRSSTKRNIRKSLREGVQIEISNSLESFTEFYKLHIKTRKRYGGAIEPIHFYRNIFKHIISRGNGIVFLASYKKRIIAAAVYFQFGKCTNFQYGASDLKYQHLRPNNLIMWEAIKWYLQNGFESLSFGVTECENSGLRQFKNGMATTEQTVCYFVYNFLKNNFIFHNSLNTPTKRKILRNTPIQMLRILGKLFSKHTNSYYFLKYPKWLG